MALDWTKIYKRYRGLWVALKEDEKTVVASGRTAREAKSGAEKKKYPLPILFRVPTKVLPYVGCFWR